MQNKTPVTSEGKRILAFILVCLMFLGTVGDNRHVLAGNWNDRSNVEEGSDENAAQLLDIALNLDAGELTADGDFSYELRIGGELWNGSYFVNGEENFAPEGQILVPADSLPATVLFTGAAFPGDEIVFTQTSGAGLHAHFGSAPENEIPAAQAAEEGEVPVTQAAEEGEVPVTQAAEETEVSAVQAAEEGEVPVAQAAEEGEIPAVREKQTMYAESGEELSFPEDGISVSLIAGEEPVSISVQYDEYAEITANVDLFWTDNDALRPAAEEMADKLHLTFALGSDGFRVLLPENMEELGLTEMPELAIYAVPEDLPALEAWLNSLSAESRERLADYLYTVADDNLMATEGDPNGVSHEVLAEMADYFAGSAELVVDEYLYNALVPVYAGENHWNFSAAVPSYTAAVNGEKIKYGAFEDPIEGYQSPAFADSEYDVETGIYDITVDQSR